ncbi:uncharacterized protein LOC133892220 [Phragmites australis]|uniref:uncharacterized protein LOC133892220 n=1 Tax=Phragmites australis TaxID=29695 RepID=UPI002D7A2FCD|nr:uncharacterized protein LOC133892220 [Phragmites australis]
MWAKNMGWDVLVPPASSVLMLVMGPLILDAVSTTAGEPVLTCGDAAAVTARLGIPRWRCRSSRSDKADRSSECRPCGAAELVRKLAGGGSESERELDEAFYDRGEDGFICAAELWCVNRRLGFAEEARTARG